MDQRTKSCTTPTNAMYTILIGGLCNGTLKAMSPGDISIPAPRASKAPLPRYTLAEKECTMTLQSFTSWGRIQRCSSEQCQIHRPSQEERDPSAHKHRSLSANKSVHFILMMYWPPCLEQVSWLLARAFSTELTWILDRLFHKMTRPQSHLSPPARFSF